MERDRANMRRDRHARREREKLARVFAREIGDRAQHSLLPEYRVRKTRDVAHMDAAADDDASLAHRFESGGHKGAGGSADDGGVERSRRTLLGASGPDRAERAGELLRRKVARPDGGGHLAPRRS